MGPPAIEVNPGLRLLILFGSRACGDAGAHADCGALYGSLRHMVYRAIIYQTSLDAELLFHERVDYDDGAIVEMVLWRVPSPVQPSAHALKYSLFYGRSGVREVGYDNERGKGDHRHFRGTEAPYTFSSVEQLMVDFWSDVRALRGGT